MRYRLRPTAGLPGRFCLGERSAFGAASAAVKSIAEVERFACAGAQPYGQCRRPTKLSHELTERPFGQGVVALTPLPFKAFLEARLLAILLFAF